VFARTCAACHRRGDTPGGDLGPDLATVRHRPPASLLADILLPSRSIAQHYETYLVERRNGESDAGLLGAQTPTTITLRQAGARELAIERAEIAKMTVVPQSTMPSDLATLIAPEAMADLLAFLRR
jgi:putative heme-binding domain-containing protein